MEINVIIMALSLTDFAHQEFLVVQCLFNHIAYLANYHNILEMTMFG